MIAALDPDCSGALVVLGPDLAAVDRLLIALPRPGRSRQRRLREVADEMRAVVERHGVTLIGVEDALRGSPAGVIRGALWACAVLTGVEVADLPVPSQSGWHRTGRVRVRGIPDARERAVAEARTTIEVRRYAFPAAWGAARDLDGGTAQALCMARWMAASAARAA